MRVFFSFMVINGDEIYFRVALFACTWFEGMELAEEYFQNVQK